MERQALQTLLESLNPHFIPGNAVAAPDGDAETASVDYGQFEVPECARCGGMLKPDVVFFGENVPPPVVAQAAQAVDDCDLLLVVGSSLTVWSSYRFARQASERGVDIVAINIGPTRADPILSLKVEARCGDVLPRLVPLLGVSV
jgi:NAD-dependent SIR2 family protein deacetylase